MRTRPASSETSAWSLSKSRRYGQSDDLRRFLEGRPIRQRRPAPWEPALKWAKRRPAAAAWVVLGLAGLLSLAAGGLYYLATNSGRYTRDAFAAVPEIGVKIGYQLTSHVSVTGSYNFLYLSRVVRPGDQVNTAVNPTFLPTSPTLGVPFGPRLPSFPFTESDFWAHGVNIGLAVTY